MDKEDESSQHPLWFYGYVMASLWETTYVSRCQANLENGNGLIFPVPCEVLSRHVLSRHIPLIKCNLVCFNHVIVFEQQTTIWDF